MSAVVVTVAMYGIYMMLGNDSLLKYPKVS